MGRDRARSRERYKERGRTPPRRRRSRSSDRRVKRRSRSRSQDRAPKRSRSRSPKPPRSPRPETRDCFKCGQTGHLARDCPSGGSGGGSGSDRKGCFKCGQPGHVARDCTASREEIDESKMQYGRPGHDNEEGNGEPVDKQMPNFEKSGKLLEETNTFKGVVLKYSEPEDARKPKLHWRLYPFKGDQELPVLHIHRQSAYLLGRERRVADIPLDHPSCSQQHAVLQYRLATVQKDDGTVVRRVRPYIIDLGSANGTMLNGTKVDAQRYYQLKAQDCLKFGYSTREYVVMFGEMGADAGEED